MIRPPPRSPLFPSTPLSRSHQTLGADHLARPSAASFTLTSCARRFLLPAPPLTRFPKATPSARVERSRRATRGASTGTRSEEHTSELQSRSDLVCRLLLEKK